MSIAPKRQVWKKALLSGVLQLSPALLIVVGLYFDLVEPKGIATHFKLEYSENQEFLAELLLTAIGLLIGQVLASAKLHEILAETFNVGRRVEQLLRIHVPEDYASSFEEAGNNLTQVQKDLQSGKWLDGSDEQIELANGHICRIVGDFEKTCRLLTQHEFDSDYDDCELLTHAVKLLPKNGEMIGISFWEKDERWWGGDDAKAFLKENYNAVKDKSVTIKRVFIWDDTKSKSDPNQQAEMIQNENAARKMKEVQQINGIKALVIGRSQYSSSIPHCCSMCVVGDLISYVVVADDSGVAERNSYSFSNSIMNERRKLLNDIWIAAGGD